MTKIDPEVLRKLRKSMGLSQEELAEKTKTERLPKIDKQTISRLERGDRGETRKRTIEQLARALRVEPAVLTGEKALPDVDVDPLTPKVSLNLRISSAAYNALILAAGLSPAVNPAQIVELAPFLFRWAAETSLRRRLPRINELQSALENLKTLEQSIWPGPSADYSQLEKMIETEIESIDCGDIFGTLRYEDVPFSADEEDPFATFLRDLVADFEGDAEFEGWSADGTPNYRILVRHAEALAGFDKNLAELVIRGVVPLNEMPRGSGPFGMSRQQTAEWIRKKAEELGAALKERRGVSENKESSP
jgi:transcriptional regulator with XRE-family HTH domain